MHRRRTWKGQVYSLRMQRIVRSIKVDMYHFCKKSDVLRQDKALILRSLSHQIAIRHAGFSQSLLRMSSTEVESLENVT